MPDLSARQPRVRQLDQFEYETRKRIYENARIKCQSMPIPKGEPESRRDYFAWNYAYTWIMRHHDMFLCMLAAFDYLSPSFTALFRELPWNPQKLDPEKFSHEELMQHRRDLIWVNEHSNLTEIYPGESYEESYWLAGNPMLAVSSISYEDGFQDDKWASINDVDDPAFLYNEKLAAEKTRRHIYVHESGMILIGPHVLSSRGLSDEPMYMDPEGNRYYFPPNGVYHLTKYGNLEELNTHLIIYTKNYYGDTMGEDGAFLMGGSTRENLHYRVRALQKEVYDTTREFSLDMRSMMFVSQNRDGQRQEKTPMAAKISTEKPVQKALPPIQTMTAAALEHRNQADSIFQYTLWHMAEENRKKPLVL